MANKIGILFEAVTQPIKNQVNSLMATLSATTQKKKPNINIETNLDKVNKQIVQYDKLIADSRAEVKLLNQELKQGLGGPATITAIKEQNRQIAENKLKLSEARKEARRLKQEDLPGYFNNFGKSLSDTIKRIGLFTAAFTVINQTKNLIGGATRTAIEFESALAGVNKTLDLSIGELQGMDRELKRLSTQIPLTYVELAKIAEIGGQLGVPAEQISQFTETMAQLRATTNLTSEEAIINFAKFNNVVGVTGDEIAKVGSVLVELGNNSATTESQILTFGRRIAASGKLAGLSAPEILAVGAAFSSAGIEAEAGGTAVQKVLLSIATAVREGGDNLELYAATAGKTSEEFAKYWREDAGNALADFVTGLQQAGDRSFDILGQLGEDNVRTVRAFLSTANSSQTLARAVELVNDEFANTNALQEEFQKRADTAESKLIIQRNQWELLGETLGKRVAPALVGVQDIAIKAIGGTPILLDLMFAKIFSSIKQSTIKNKQLFNSIGSFFKDIGDATLIGIADLSGDELTAEYIANERLKRKEAEKTRQAELQRLIDIQKEAYENYKLRLSDDLNLITGQKTAREKFIEDEIAKEKEKNQELNSLYQDLLDEEADKDSKATTEKEKELEKQQKAYEQDLEKRQKAYEQDLEKRQKAYEQDLEKRQKFLDEFYDYEVKEDKKRSEAKIKFTEKALEKILEKISTAQGDELDYYIRTAEQYREIIEKNTKVVEKATKTEEEFIKSVYEELQDQFKDAGKQAEELQDKLDKLQEQQKDTDTKIAERRLEIEEEILEVKEKIRDLERDGVSLSSAQGFGKDILTTIGKGEVGGQDVESMLKILELNEDLDKLEKELTENKDVLNEAVFDQVKAYEELSETQKLLFDNREKEKELLEDIGGGYDNIEEAIEGIKEQQKEQSIELESQRKAAELLEKRYTSVLGEETTKRGEFVDSYIAKVQELINKQRELNALMGDSSVSGGSSSSSTSNSSNTNINNNITINAASNPYDTGRQVAKVVNAGNRGSIASSNS